MYFSIPGGWFNKTATIGSDVPVDSPPINGLLLLSLLAIERRCDKAPWSIQTLREKRSESAVLTQPQGRVEVRICKERHDRHDTNGINHGFLGSQLPVTICSFLIQTTQV